MGDKKIIDKAALKLFWDGFKDKLHIHNNKTVLDNTTASYTTAEKEKLNGIDNNANNYSLPAATTSSLGGTRIGYTQNGKKYPVELDVNNKMFVNVPWTDTVYTHPEGTNPHGTTKSDVGLGNVGNFKAVSTVANQGLTDTEKSNARTNIGAGTSSFSGNYNDLSNKPTIPTNVSQLTNDSGFKTTDNNTTYTLTQDSTDGHKITLTPSSGSATTITIPDNDTTYSSATTSKDGLMSSADKTKLNGIAEGANKYVHPGSGTNPHGTTKADVGLGNVVNVSTNDQTPTYTESSTRTNIVSGEKLSTAFGKIKKWFSDLKTVSFTGSYNDLGDKPTIPTKTSELTNDSGFKTTDTNTWRGIQDNLTSTSTSDSLSANQGKVLKGLVDGKLAKTTYEYNKEIAFGSTGKLLIGKFSLYDTGIFVDISSTTNKTYNAKLVIAAQNYVIQKASVYNDTSDMVAPNIFIKPSSTSDTIAEVYFSPTAYSKNSIHIVCVAPRAAVDESIICTSVSTIPSTATLKPTNELTNAFASSSHTHNYAGSSSAGGAATSASKLNTNAGSATQPVYFANGVPVATTYTLGKSVPSDAVFTDTNTTYSNFVKSGTGAKSGLVPAPSTTAGTTKYLREDGTWTTPPDNNTTYANFVKSGSGAKAGLVPAPSTTAGTTKYLREDGTWTVPPTSSTTLSSLGLTATATELNYVDGVTSNIQTQLNEKSATSHASSATTYGKGTTSAYGHLKISDAFSNTPSATTYGASAGVAASLYAAQFLYQSYGALSNRVRAFDGGSSALVGTLAFGISNSSANVANITTKQVYTTDAFPLNVYTSGNVSYFNVSNTVTYRYKFVRASLGYDMSMASGSIPTPSSNPSMNMLSVTSFTNIGRGLDSTAYGTIKFVPGTYYYGFNTSRTTTNRGGTLYLYKQ